MQILSFFPQAYAQNVNSCPILLEGRCDCSQDSQTFKTYCANSDAFGYVNCPIYKAEALSGEPIFVVNFPHVVSQTNTLENGNNGNGKHKISDKSLHDRLSDGEDFLRYVKNHGLKFMAYGS